MKILASIRDISYEALLQDLIESYKAFIPFQNEKSFAEWFEQNYKFFKIQKILFKQVKCPDYIVMDTSGKKVRVELELFSNNFVRHNHDPKKVDIIISAFSGQKEIKGVPVFSLFEKNEPPFYEIKSRSFTLSIPEKMARKLHEKGINVLNNNEIRRFVYELVDKNLGIGGEPREKKP